MADKKFHTSDTSLTNVNISLAQIRSSSKKKPEENDKEKDSSVFMYQKKNMLIRF